ncbi:LAFA_0E14928g1_1 [Lachancea sp. 'fantastica']|nr:LAFA_0E14928g1_1 [Lachancea sp. 'fantastica']
MEAAGDEVLSALTRENGKLAVQLSGKLCAKYPKASYPKILEQYVRFRLNGNVVTGNESLEQLLAKCGVPSDLRSLELMHRFRLELAQPDRALEAYKAAMQKYPSAEIGYAWFGKSIEDSNYRNMAQSAFQLRRWSQDPRMIQFWYALSTVASLKLQPGQLSTKERLLNATLAYKSIESLKPFRSDQETVIFCHVCEICENKSQVIVDELLPRFLKGTEKGFSVDLYLKNFLITHLTKLEDHVNLVEVCKRLLTLLDDFGLLTQFIESSKILNLPRKEVEAIIKARDSRNHRLAHVRLDSVYDGSVSNGALDFYLEKFHDKPCCVPDLEHYKEKLPSELIEQSFRKLESGLMHDCNYSRLTDVNGIELFIILFAKYKRTLDEKLKTDYSPCSYFILKIVESLINDTNYTFENALTSIAILEQYQTLDPYNFDTRVWLVVLYNHLGCPSLAFGHYAQLKVKNLQLETVDFLMTTRYASLFPVKDHPFFEHLAAGSNVYESIDNLPRFVQIAFERQSYGKILGMLELHDKLARSTGRWSKQGERLLQARLFNDKRSGLLKNLHESWRQLSLYNLNYGISLEDCKLIELNDNRDFSVLGPMLKNCTTVTAYLKQDNAAVLAASLREMMLGTSGVNELSISIDQILQQHGCALTAQMTASEAWGFEVARIVYESQSNSAKTPELLTKLRARPGVQLNGWLLCHDYHTQLATLKSLDQLKRIKDPELKGFIKSQLRLLREKGPLLFEDYISTISAAKPNISILEKLRLDQYDLEIAKNVQTIFKVARNL